MKKNLSILFVVLLGLSLVLAACGGGGTTDPNALLGSWKVDGSEETFTFFDDGSVAYLNGDQGAKGAFNYDGTTLNIQLEGAEKQTLTVQISGDTMTWSQSGNSQTLTKVK